MFDKLIYSKYEDIKFNPCTLRDIIFNPLPHRDETCNVIYSHIGEQFITISLAVLRKITFTISENLKSHGLKTGDTILLASFSSSNELANALIFAGATCIGIRVFVPIFPEPDEFKNWREQTAFKAVIIPYLEILQHKACEREKEVVAAIQFHCNEYKIPLLDAYKDFCISELIQSALDQSTQTDPILLPQADISPQTEAVIFTTSGTSGVSKLLVYTHEAFVNSCQSWQACSLFGKELFGNPGFSPLFTHTIGIRTFINSIWSGNPFSIIVTDWFLRKPEVVRYFLLKIKPGHVIAGPAFYNILLELFRQFPELKNGIQQSLQAAISIGAPYDLTTAMKFKSATGVMLMNGFGTTETLMVSLNKSEDSENIAPGNIGMLLPGVSIGLRKTNIASVFELNIHSAFQSARTLGTQLHSEYFETGDLVKYDENTNAITFYGRKSSDFIKDEFGVKLPLCALQLYYKDLYKVANLIEWIPLVNIPGLAALIFLPSSTINNNQKEFASLIKNINEELKQSIEPFEYSHRHIERFSLVYDEVPLTRKGSVSKDQIYKKYGQLIAELRNPFIYDQKIETTETGDKNAVYKFSNPYLAELLEALKMDKIFIKGEGDYLYYKEGNTLHRALDLVGGFGSNLLGHNHPKIKEAILQFLESGYPAINNQGSQYFYPGLLAKELNHLFSKTTGKYFKVILGNSGTEATEIALHHAYFEWRQKIEKIRDGQLQLYGAVAGIEIAKVWDENMQLLENTTPGLLVVNNCFHGYSSGARSMLNHKKQRYLFSGLLRPKPLLISDTAPDWKDEVLQYIKTNVISLQIFKKENGNCVYEAVNFSSIIASIIEPVRGEGGILEVNPDLADFCAHQDFPLICDEIQCGLGRTGSLPSYKNASYYLLGKSLGGGIEKIAAVLIDDNRFKPMFTKYYNSTFANGELAACTALTTLKIIEDENLVEQAQVKGLQLNSLMQEIASGFPDVIESVNGKGLMIGIFFNHQMGAENNFFRILIEQEVLGYLFAAWLLNKHHIRVLPSLSRPNSIRVEPSFYITEAEILIFGDALKELCLLCRNKKVYELCKFLMNEDPYPDKIPANYCGMFPQQIETPLKNAVKVGFVGNFTLPHRELQIIEPDFQQASDTGLRILFNRLQILLEGKPIKIMSKNLMDGKVHFTFYILPFSTSQLEIANRWGKKRFYIAKIQQAINTMSKEGVVCISLGGHTSIISGNGLNLAESKHCKLLTGNSMTVASCLFYLNHYLEHTKIDSNKAFSIAIVGANGNIGTGVVSCLDEPKYAKYEIILAGNNEKRLQKLKEKLSFKNIPVVCTSDLFELKRADVIICCANTNDPIIFPHHISEENQVYVIDISVPSAVSEEVKKLTNVRFCKDASSVYLGDNPEFLISTHTPKSKIFCCAAESILCALYDMQEPMVGHIQKETVLKMIDLGVKEGFFKSMSV